MITDAQQGHRGGGLDGDTNFPCIRAAGVLAGVVHVGLPAGGRWEPLGAWVCVPAFLMGAAKSSPCEM